LHDLTQRMERLLTDCFLFMASLVQRGSSGSASTIPLSLSQLALREAMQGISAALSSRFGAAFSGGRFHDHHGRNVALRHQGQSAVRTASYNQVLFSISSHSHLELYSKET